MSDKRKEIETLIDKAAKAHDAAQAINFAQAALAWNCHDRDLCPSCAAKEAVAHIFAESN